MKNGKNKPPFMHLNLNVRGIPQSATLRINDLSAELIGQGKKVYKMGLGQSPFPVPEQVVEELKINAYQKDYLPVKGLKILRESVSDYYKRTQGTEYSAEDVLVGPGSKELMFLLQLVYYGDLVIPTPSWVSYAPQAHIIGRHVRWVPTKREDCWKLTPEELSNLCSEDPDRPRIVILNYPSNPSGCTYKTDELKEIARVARKYKVILLSDEIYGELHHQGQHVSIARFYAEGTIISGGLSKWCGAGGWRLGTFVFPETLRWLLDSMASVASETFTSTSAPVQYAAVTAFKGSSEIEKYLKLSRKVLRTIGREISEKLRDTGVIVPQPAGGFYLFVDFSGFSMNLKKRSITNSVELCSSLLSETGCAILPGVAFGRPLEELTARIAYVNFDGAKALVEAGKYPEESRLDKTFLSNCCGEMVNAIGSICEWLKI